MSPLASSIISSLRRLLHEVDELRNPAERSAIYSALSEHTRSAEPMVWSNRRDAEIADFLETDLDLINPVAADHLRMAATAIRDGKWRE